MEENKESKGACHCFVRWLLPAFFLLLPLCAGAQSASSTPSEALSPRHSTGATSPHGGPFRFTKVDLNFLQAANAFDAYVEEQGWIYNDPDLNHYLENLGNSLTPSGTLEHVRWRFRVLRDVQLNAFALPNGSIYLYSGLISRMENEAQLAGVLAHEITHVVNRHGYLENRSARRKMVAIDVVLAAASAGNYAGINPAITMAIGNLLPMIVVETMFGYSRELEHEADVAAVDALYLRGYDLREFSRGFYLLQNGPEVDLAKESVFWASHPKLVSRVRYVSSSAAQRQQDSRGLLVNQREYRTATVNVIRANATLAMLLGQPRTAFAIAQRLIEQEPRNPENYVLLGDAYRNLGARTPLPQPEELTEEAKEATRKLMHKTTIAEYDKALLAQPGGPDRCQANVNRAQEAYQKALSLDPQNATAHRGLGFLYERQNSPADAIAQFQMYLELVPDAKDARQVRVHLENLRATLERHDVHRGAQ